MQNQNVFSRLIFFKKNKKGLASPRFFLGKSGGFTLIELLLAVSIIALLTSLILVLLSGARAQGSEEKGVKYLFY